MEVFEHCTLCPRACGVDRTRGERGFCGASDAVFVARAALHEWEEPPLSGENGSGTVFFAHCTLGCVFCQNRTISRRTDAGRCVDAGRLAEIFLELADKGAHNINLVTATHYVPVVCAALQSARDQGLQIPVVYNN
ncbi:MAG: hypothetical protein Q4A76_04355, partial [Porphyromonadaceae bacterium]|nr:hypothetical protein [Porphyromonadaceae bacterium]